TLARSWCTCGLLRPTADAVGWRRRLCQRAGCARLRQDLCAHSADPDDALSKYPLLAGHDQIGSVAWTSSASARTAARVFLKSGIPAPSRLVAHGAASYPP